MNTDMSTKQWSMVSRVLVLLALCMTMALGTGCDTLTDFKEINTNPNEPLNTPENLQLVAVETQFAYFIAGGEPVRTPTLWVQQIAENFNDPSADRYIFGNGDSNNLWAFNLYTGTIKDARLLKEQALANENFEYAGVAQLFEAWSYAVLTDFFGPAPLTQAFQPETNPTPAYDGQSVIYAEIFRLLNEAVTNLDRGNADANLSLADGDLVYGGDTDRWKALANTLIAKYHLRLSEADGELASVGLSGGQTRANAALDALEDGISTNAGNARFNFPGGGNEENPWFQYTVQGIWDLEWQLSENYIGILKTREDLRLPVQARQVGAISPTAAPADGYEFEPFDPSEDFAPTDSTYLGHQNGLEDASGTSDVSSIGEFYSAASAPVFFQTAADAKLMEAQAHLINGAVGPARAAFEDGIRLSLEQLDVASYLANNGVAGLDANQEIDDFVDARLADYDAASNNPERVEQVMTEKYIANFLGLDVWADWRLTGYPQIDPVADAQTRNGEIPRRYPYPTSELNNNQAQVPAPGIGETGLICPVEWDPAPSPEGC